MSYNKKASLKEALSKTLQELAEVEEKEQRFGDGSQYSDTDVIYWTRTFPTRPPVRRWVSDFNNYNGGYYINVYDSEKSYTYVALKIEGLWFVTGARAENQYLTYEALVEKHLQHADELWVATDWRQEF